ncbi:MAG: site-specific DNA-methyltransferase [Alphaproteobacteria bacterium]|nr:site-specific DNA-methyltransferase [Alphaproteobacteria bacterium]
MPDLDFKGKPFVYAHHLSVPFRELIIDKKKSLPGPNGPSLDDNLIIHGDNLEALKALLPRYAGKVDVIYIDPPYNTGNEGWSYNDNVNAPLMRQWLGRTVDREDLERHDKWLCMMWPRLELLRELLRPDGVLFVSIDDNEQSSLHQILLEQFGERNWLGTIIWKNVTDNNPTNVSVEHEYVICFANDRSKLAREWKSPISAIKEKLVEVGTDFVAKHPAADELSSAYSAWFRQHKSELWPLDRYKYIDQGGVYTGSQSVHNPGREGYRYDVIHPGTKKPCKQPLMGYRFPQETMKELLSGGRILFGDDENKIIEIKVYASEFEDKLPSVITLDGRLAAYELRDIFNDRGKAFDNAKPTELIRQLLSFTLSKNSVVLDSFAGSGTTAHAVLDLNRRDNGARRFILVETEPYADDLTAERVRRVIKGVRNAKDETLKKGLGGSFTYCELGDALDLDRFFKGQTSPAWDQVARYIVFTATGTTLPKVPAKPTADWFVGEAGGYRIHLLYKPDLAFMRSEAAAVSAQLADRIAKSNTEKRPVLLYAASRYVSQKELSKRGITFCQLPFAIHRLLGDGPTRSSGDAA